MRIVRPSFLAVSSILLLGFGCSSSSSSDDAVSGATGASGSSGHGTAGATGTAGAANGAAGKGGTNGGAGAPGGAGASASGAGGLSATAGSGGSATNGGGASAGGASGSSGAGAAGKGGAGGAGTAGSGGKGGASGGGAGAGGGSAGSGGATQTGTLPGDIAAAAGTPMVAAHSATRAMFAAYNGKLFQVRRPTDTTTQDINTVAAGGLVDLTALNAFCSGTTCTVTKLYDQTGNGNDMSQGAAANQPTIGFWTASNATKYPMIVSKGYQWLRNRTAVKKIPTGSNPQTEYFVVHGDNAGRATGTNGCCYDYGNMETHITDDGPGTMTALYFGDATDWTRGAGNGPWVMLDMENGVFAGGGPISILNSGTSSVNPSDPSLKYAAPNIVTGLAKTDGKKTFEIKYGNASTGPLSVAWNGSLPTNTNPTSYIPLQQQGGISLGEGGDGSAMGTGAFSEGAIIAAQTTDATDTAIQTNLTTIYK
jgi:non-reducing end alpha-L-arabinofuranosidase